MHIISMFKGGEFFSCPPPLKRHFQYLYLKKSSLKFILLLENDISIKKNKNQQKKYFKLKQAQSLKIIKRKLKRSLINLLVVARVKKINQTHVHFFFVRQIDIYRSNELCYLIEDAIARRPFSGHATAKSALDCTAGSTLENAFAAAHPHGDCNVACSRLKKRHPSELLCIRVFFDVFRERQPPAIMGLMFMYIKNGVLFGPNVCFFRCESGRFLNIVCKWRVYFSTCVRIPYTRLGF